MHIRRSFMVLALFFLSACVDTSGLTQESSRPPHPQSNANAAVSVTEFADLQCPACQAAHEHIVMPILKKYGSQIRFDFMHFPLRSIHRYALDAGETSECAADQGKFWEFVDLAYKKQADLNYDALLQWGAELKLDDALLKRCWKSRIKKETVLSDYEEGKSMGVMGTPSFFVDGEKVESGFDTLSEGIEKALAATKQRL